MNTELSVKENNENKMSDLQVMQGGEVKIIEGEKIIEIKGKEATGLDVSKNFEKIAIDSASNPSKSSPSEKLEHKGEEETEAPEIPNWITLVKQYPAIKNSPKTLEIIHLAEGPIFSFTVVIFLSIIVIIGTRKAKMIPGRLQTLIEIIVEKFYKMVCDILGQKNGRRFLPYIGTLFLFIFFNNILGIIPFMKSSTSLIQTTGALAILTFLYVQFIGIKENGIFGYLHHMAGSPNDTITWLIAPLMFPLHVIGELAKPLSLSLRLFGNIMGEDILLGVFVFFGVAMLGFTHLPIGIPLQFPFIFLALLTSTIQALVFTLLSTIYFLLVLPHDEEHHKE